MAEIIGKESAECVKLPLGINLYKMPTDIKKLGFDWVGEFNRSKPCYVIHVINQPNYNDEEEYRFFCAVFYKLFTIKNVGVFHCTTGYGPSLPLMLWAMTYYDELSLELKMSKI